MKTLAAVLLLACSGCITDMLNLTDTSWESYCERNRINLAKLSIGMTMAEVEEIMGTGRFGDPTNTPWNVEAEPLAGEDGEVMYEYVIRWLYVIQPARTQAHGEVTAVLFNAEGLLLAGGRVQR